MFMRCGNIIWYNICGKTAKCGKNKCLHVVVILYGTIYVVKRLNVVKINVYT